MVLALSRPEMDKGSLSHIPTLIKVNLFEVIVTIF